MIPRELRAAFAAVYQAEHGRLLRYLRRRVGPDEAPDLVQEVFARLLRCGDYHMMRALAGCRTVVGEHR